MPNHTMIRTPHPLDPQHALEPGSAEIELSRAEWQIICGAVLVLSLDGRGSDIDRIKTLADKLEQYKTASHATIEVWE